MIDYNQITIIITNMKPSILSCLIISVFIHELVMVDKFSNSLCVEATSLSWFYYNDLINFREKVRVTRGLNNLDRNKGGRRVLTPSPPKPNSTIRWKPILPPSQSPPPPPRASSTSYPPWPPERRPFRASFVVILCLYLYLSIVGSVVFRCNMYLNQIFVDLFLG